MSEIQPKIQERDDKIKELTEDIFKLKESKKISETNKLNIIEDLENIQKQNSKE